jgi:phosphate transport system protein
MSTHFSRDTANLTRKLMTMGALVEQGMQRATFALFERRGELVDEVIANDLRVDRTEVEIEEDCLKILALHHPVSGDLRFVATVLKVNNSLERMGDYAKNIAERAADLANVPEIALPAQLREMAYLAIDMVRRSLDAFVKGDAPEACRIVRDDDQVDDLNRTIIHDLRARIEGDPSLVDRCLFLLSTSRYYERIADHATNIAEDVVYMVDGEIIRHRAGRRLGSEQDHDRDAREGDDPTAREIRDG